MSRDNFAVFALSGFNARAVIALCRFCTSSNIPIHLAAKDASDPIYLTDYKHDVFLERVSSTLGVRDFCNWLFELRNRFGYEKILIAPTSEFFNRFLLSNRDEIESSGGIIPLVDKELYESVSDKHSFDKLCRRHGIRVPSELDRTTRNFPFVAKPLEYAGRDGRQLKPHLLLDHASWRDFQENEDPDDFYYQEFIHGTSVYLLMYISRTGEVTKYSQENLIQQARGGSIILAKRSAFHLSEESEKYAEMLVSEKFSGLVMIEVRLNDKTEKSVVIEANPRMWGPIQFALDNNVNLLGEWVRDFSGMAGLEDDGAALLSEYYFWSGGLSESGKPFSYHGYEPEKFLNDYKRIVSCDLFRRKDTWKLYEQEIKS